MEILQDDILERNEAHFVTLRYVRPKERKCPGCSGRKIGSETCPHEGLGFVILLTCQECGFKGYV